MVPDERITSTYFRGETPTSDPREEIFGGTEIFKFACVANMYAQCLEVAKYYI